MPDHTTQKSDAPIEILLVEDNPGDIRLIEEAFKSSERETILQTVTNGSDAIEWLTQRATETEQSLPEMVLLDLNLPGRDGYDVLRAIRADSQLELLPVIILTSSSAPEDIKRCYNSDANAYMTKPIDPAEFESLVAKVEEFWFQQAELPPIPS